MANGFRMLHIEPTRTHEPRTDYYCFICGKDIDEHKPHRTMHVIQGGDYVLHPLDEADYESDGGDLGGQPIGSDCAKKLGLEWTFRND